MKTSTTIFASLCLALSLGLGGSAQARGAHHGGHSGGGHHFHHHHFGLLSPGLRGYRSAPLYRAPRTGHCADCARNAAVQAALARRGYYRGPIDSIIGSGSRRALRDFQRAARLPESGRIDRATLDRLGLA